MKSDENIERFWDSYLSKLPKNHIHRFFALPKAWSFGNSEEMANKARHYGKNLNLYHSFINLI